MAAVDELLKLARDCYAQARSASNVTTKAELLRMGDEYMKAFEEMQRGQTVMHAAFPKPGGKTG